MRSPHRSRQGKPLIFLGALGLVWIGARVMILSLSPGEDVDPEAPRIALATQAGDDLVADIEPEAVDAPERAPLEMPVDATAPTGPSSGVEGLDPVPPAFVAPPAEDAAVHNLLWMTASQRPAPLVEAEPEPTDGGSAADPEESASSGGF